MTRFTRGRRRTSVLLGTALLALAVGVSVGLAKSGPSQVQVSLYPRVTPPICPVSTGKHVHGTATVIGEKGVVTVRVHLRDAVPGKYAIQLRVPEVPLSSLGCVRYGPRSIGTFGVDSNGDGQGSGTLVGVTKQTFAVNVFSVDVVQEYVSPFFKLGSS